MGPLNGSRQSIVDPATQLPLIEEWRLVPGLPRYWVSSEGRVRTRSSRILRTHQVKGGYERVKLAYPNGKERNFLVHRLVALAFLGPCPEGMQVNHENGNVHDNSLRNLEYVTPSGNVRHSLTVLGRRRAQGERNGNAVLTNAQVLELRRVWVANAFKTKKALADNFGISNTACCRILNGKHWRSVA